jgi:hypothetical protein
VCGDGGGVVARSVRVKSGVPRYNGSGMGVRFAVVERDYSSMRWTE